MGGGVDGGKGFTCSVMELKAMGFWPGKPPMGVPSGMGAKPLDSFRLEGTLRVLGRAAGALGARIAIGRG